MEMAIEFWRDYETNGYKMRCQDCGEIAEVKDSVLAAMNPQLQMLFRPENLNHQCKPQMEHKP